MGRSPKKGVDYFSHDTNAAGRPTIYTIESEFGNDGYALWFKLLEYLGSTEGLYLDKRNRADWLYFVAKSRVSEETAIKILDRIAETGAIDIELWKHGIIWSDNFTLRLSDVYKKRGTAIPIKPIICDGKSNEQPQCTTEKSIDSTPEESTPKKPKGKKKSSVSKEDEKITYSEFVKMKETEYDILCQQVGKAATDKAIELLDNYKGSSGKKYQSDYRAILSWVLDKVREKYPRLIQEAPKEPDADGGNPFSDC